MILFLACEVKASAATIWIFSFFLICRERAGIFVDHVMSSQQIVLASTSPFRRELLGRLKISFTVANPETDEAVLDGESPEQTALRLSEAKARAVAKKHPDALIIGSDQVAFLGNQTFGKPGNHENAGQQLKTMRGKTVNFYTGLCLLNAKTGMAHVTGIPTLVTFRDLSDDEIENYLQMEKPYNCAGSAKSEGLGIAVIARMQGDDPNALVGLPLIALCNLLQQEGISIL